MPARITCAVLLLLGVAVLIVLDHLYVQDMAWRRQMGLNGAAGEMAEKVGAFFQERQRFVSALAAWSEAREGRMDPVDFARAVERLSPGLAGLSAAALLDKTRAPVARWPSRPVSDRDPGSVFCEGNDWKAVVRRAEEGPTAIVGEPYNLPNGGTAALIAQRVVAGDDSGFVLAEFRLPNDINPTRLQERQTGHIAVVVSPGGNRFLPPGLPADFRAEVRRGVAVGDGTWWVEAASAPNRRAEMTETRLFLWGCGGALIVSFVLFYFALAARNAGLAELTERLEAEATAARESNERLARANRELDEFAFTVSHDLKEPLRGIEGLTRLLSEECGPALGESGREYVRLAREATGRLQRLVQDLLRLCRSTRRQYPHEPTCFRELVGEALDSLRYMAAERNAMIAVVTELPTVRCDRVRMAEVFQNLISNALKFANGRPPVVRIGGEDAGAAYRFWVSDNGPGVPEPHRQRIFQIFQRLHGPSEEGTSVGLTICKKIVESHGGRIWVEPSEEGGARFCFTLPKDLQNAPAGDGPSPEDASPARADKGKRTCPIPQSC